MVFQLFNLYPHMTALRNGVRWRFSQVAASPRAGARGGWAEGTA